MREAVKEMMKARSMKRTAQPFEPALNDEETEDSTAHLKQVIQAQDHTTEVTSQPAQSIAPPKLPWSMRPGIPS
jgi:hypothetical protein